MGLYIWIALGCVVGIVARVATVGRVTADWLEPMLMGIAGGVVGGWIGTRIAGGNGIDYLGWLAMSTAVAGAAIIVTAYLTQRRNRTSRSAKAQPIDEPRQKAA